jgi:hypothetical protein
MSEHERFSLLKGKIDTIELKLEAESHNRQEAHQNLEAHVEAELVKISDRTSAELKQLHLSIKSTMDQLTRTANDLNSCLSQEREQRAADLDHVGMSLCEKVDQVVHTVEEERFARLEQERQSLKRCVSRLCSEFVHCNCTCADACFGLRRSSVGVKLRCKRKLVLSFAVNHLSCSIFKATLNPAMLCHP